MPRSSHGKTLGEAQERREDLHVNHAEMHTLDVVQQSMPKVHPLHPCFCAGSSAYPPVIRACGLRGRRAGAVKYTASEVSGLPRHLALSVVPDHRRPAAALRGINHNIVLDAAVWHSLRAAGAPAFDEMTSWIVAPTLAIQRVLQHVVDEVAKIVSIPWGQPDMQRWR